MEPLVDPTLPHVDQSHGLTQHRLGRRRLLGAAAVAGMSWLTPVAEVLAQRAEQHHARTGAIGHFVVARRWAEPVRNVRSASRPAISAGTRAIETACLAFN